MNEDGNVKHVQAESNVCTYSDNDTDSWLWHRLCVSINIHAKLVPLFYSPGQDAGATLGNIVSNIR